jgi:hypothetical protein
MASVRVSVMQAATVPASSVTYSRHQFLNLLDRTLPGSRRHATDMLSASATCIFEINTTWYQETCTCIFAIKSGIDAASSPAAPRVRPAPRGSSMTLVESERPMGNPPAAGDRANGAEPRPVARVSGGRPVASHSWSSPVPPARRSAASASRSRLRACGRKGQVKVNATWEDVRRLACVAYATVDVCRRCCMCVAHATVCGARASCVPMLVADGNLRPWVPPQGVLGKTHHHHGPW